MMYKLISIILFMWITCCFAAHPQNLNDARAAVSKYYESGQYNVEVSRAIANAENYLKQRIAENKNKKLAVVFDIDETLITAYPIEKKTGFAQAPQWIDYYLKSDKDVVIAPSLSLFNYAKRNNVAVFLITGRDSRYRQVAIDVLHKCGYKNWNRLYTEPNNYHLTHHSVAPFKTSVRKKLEAEGYDVVLTVGDQYSDLKGGYADHQIKLPNYLYKVP